MACDRYVQCVLQPGDTEGKINTTFFATQPLWVRLLPKIHSEISSSIPLENPSEIPYKIILGVFRKKNPKISTDLFKKFHQKFFDGFFQTILETFIQK